jgi:chorismate dehydratase
LEPVGALSSVELVADAPDRLSDALAAGTPHVGPNTLVEALLRANDLVVMPEVAVVADGPVLSVCLESQQPLTQLPGATIALGSTSRTRVRLARLLLRSDSVCMTCAIGPSHRTWLGCSLTAPTLPS